MASHAAMPWGMSEIFQLKNLEDERVPGLAYGLGLAGLVPFFFFGLAHGGGTGEDNYGNRYV